MCKGVRVDVCLSVSSLMLRNKQTKKWFGKPKSDGFAARESDQMRLKQGCNSSSHVGGTFLWKVPSSAATMIVFPSFAISSQNSTMSGN